ncbi:hypothetical protein HFN86_08975 [Rhizobium laguerreae]|uniref:hypothetical protein n=1 Tax=Rhizobium laguerreae TaxID=1076926 RepID=UPI001C9299ED|nr:hypothetical protein [Rhizobium laguerreae]MBY3420344.1 hypothetical protein [Rhizobium laguerreae]
MNSAKKYRRIPDDFAKGFYAIDRASDAAAYCGHIEDLEAVVTKLHLAVLNEKRKKTRALSSEIKLRLQTWPEYPYLDVTEEHGDELVHQLSLSLAMVDQLSSAETRSFAVSRMLSILHNEYDAADQYTEPGND